MIYITHGNIFESSAQVIVNPVNCVGVMGAGLAKQFKERYPNSFQKYQIACRAALLEPGKLMICRENGKRILMFPTKVHWKDPSQLVYIEQGLTKLASEYQVRGIHSIAIPRIGCGLGGLDWDEVKPMIVAYLSKCSMDVYIYE